MKTSPETAYQRLLGHLQHIAPDHRTAYVKFHLEQRAAFLEMPASVGEHHAFIGGYAVHVDEVVANILKIRAVSNLPEDMLPPVSDCVIAAYDHDIDKLLMRYERDTEEPTQAQLGHYYVKNGTIRVFADETKSTLSKKIDAAVNGQPQPIREELTWHRYRKDARNMDDSAAVLFLCGKHGLGGINEDIVHAISLHHGGWAPLAQANTKIRLSRLATLLHCADLLSASAQKGEAAQRPDDNDQTQVVVPAA